MGKMCLGYAHTSNDPGSRLIPWQHGVGAVASIKDTMWHVFAALAEFERNLTWGESGPNLAADCGRVGGRKLNLEVKQIKQTKSTFARSDKQGNRVHATTGYCEQRSINTAAWAGVNKWECHEICV
jgi:hypothetical protein